MAHSRNLTQSITQGLGIAIVTGSYTPDNPFPIEAELCKEFDASRSVLREAVKMLTAKGLLSARPRQGTKVEPEKNWNLFDPDVLRWLLERKFSLALLAEFTEIRISVEPMAASLAARRASKTELLAIEHALARMEAAEQGDDDPLSSDMAFHIAILDASGNRFYIQFEDLIEAALQLSIRFTNRLKGVKFASVAEHKKVLNAILHRDPNRAKAAMESQLSDTLALINHAMAKENKQTSG